MNRIIKFRCWSKMEKKMMSVDNIDWECEDGNPLRIITINSGIFELRQDFDEDDNERRTS